MLPVVGAYVFNAVVVSTVDGLVTARIKIC